MLDLSKAYNRGSPSFVLEDLFAMHLPGYLLAIIASYLSERTMVLHFNSAMSEEQQMPASYAQGCFLMMILFIVQFNGAALHPAVPRPFPLPSASSPSTCSPSPSASSSLEPLSLSSAPSFSSSKDEERRLSVKYFDDCSIAGAYNLRRDIEKEERTLPQPLTFNQRTGHRVKSDRHIIQAEAISFFNFTEENKFKINFEKSEVLMFNFSNKVTFPPDIKIGHSDTLNEVNHAKILGLIIQSNLKWNLNTEFIYNKAAGKLWLLKRLKLFDLDIETLTDFYTKEIRVILEYAAPVWYSGITEKQSKTIEKIQKWAVSII